MVNRKPDQIYATVSHELEIKPAFLPQAVAKRKLSISFLKNVKIDAHEPKRNFPKKPNSSLPSIEDIEVELSSVKEAGDGDE